MTSRDPGQVFPRFEPVRESVPVSFVSRSALRSNAQRAHDAGVRSYAPRVLMADAWGHGAEAVRETLAAAGIAPGEDELDPHQLFGLRRSDAAGDVAAMTLVGTVLSVKSLREGEGVSYGYLHRAAADTRVALVTGGYAQGVVRSLGGTIRVAHESGDFAVIGRVAMDVCVVDIADATVTRGDNVLFFGDSAARAPHVSTWADASGLTAGEIVTTVGLRSLRRDAA